MLTTFVAAIVGVAVAAITWFCWPRDRHHIKYSRPVDPRDPSSPRRRAIIPGVTGACKQDQCPTLPSSTISTLYDIFWNNVRDKADSIFYGARKVLSTKLISPAASGASAQKKKMFTSYELGPYEWHTYGEAAARVSALGSGLRHLLKLSGSDEPEERVGFYCETCAEWLLLANSCFSQSLTAVTVYANIGLAGIALAFSQTKLRVLFTSEDLLPSVLELSSSTHCTLRHVVYIGDADPAVLAALKSNNIQATSYSELEHLGRSAPFEHRVPKPDDVALIMYTSGTTGVPKGVILPHASVLGSCMPAGHSVMPGSVPGEIFMAYLPLAHIFEIMAEFTMILTCTQIGYGTTRTLSDSFVYNCKGDLRELKPTLVIAVPAVLEKFRKGIIANVHKQSLFVRALFNFSIACKTRLIEGTFVALSNTNPVGPIRDSIISKLICSVLDKILFHKMREAVGGRVARFVCGGAPLARQTQKFLSACFCCPIMVGYGLSECSGVACVAKKEDTSFGRAGAPICTTEIKLIDVPEMGYTFSSKPYPSGEICIRGPHIARGAESFQADGYLHTGDIGRWHPDGTLEIIDRVKNVTKLAHGEIEKIETSYSRSTFVDQICLCADSTRDHIVALVVPAKSRVEAFFGRKFGLDEDDSYKTACSDASLRKAVKTSLDNAAAQARLTRIELIGNIRIVSDDWTPETGMLTSALKLKRQAIMTRYNDLIEEMYAEDAKNAA